MCVPVGRRLSQRLPALLREALPSTPAFLRRQEHCHPGRTHSARSSPPADTYGHTLACLLVPSLGPAVKGPDSARALMV